MEFSALGHCIFCADFSGKENLREVAREKPCAGAYLHDAADSCDVGDLRDYRYGTAWRVSVQSGRIPQGRYSGRNDTASPISQGVWNSFDSVRYFRNAPAGKAVLEVEGQMVYGIDFAGHFLVVGQRDYFREQ